MLADRFQLKIHQEERKTKVLILQVKQGGVKLQSVSAPVPLEKEGFLGASLGDRGGTLRGKKITITQFSKLLALDLNSALRTGQD